MTDGEKGGRDTLCPCHRITDRDCANRLVDNTIRCGCEMLWNILDIIYFRAKFISYPLRTLKSNATVKNGNFVHTIELLMERDTKLR